MTNKEIIKEAQTKIIANGEEPNYSIEHHMRDMDLIMILSILLLYGETED